MSQSAPSTLADLGALIDARPATWLPGKLVCIDGPAGSGKTTLATSFAKARDDATVVRMDDLYPGWDGLPAVGPLVLDLLAPLAAGRAGSYRRWDWHAGAPAEAHVVEPIPLLVLEGVGSGSRAWSRWCTALVWVQADPATRLARGLARDGEDVRAQWLRWTVAEDAHFAAEDTRARADLVVNT